MVLSAFCITFVVFYLTNLPPNLEKVAKSEAGSRITDAEVASWLEKNGHTQPLFKRYGEWLGVAPGWVHTDEAGVVTGRCIRKDNTPETAPHYCGILQGDWGMSNVFKQPVGEIVTTRLGLTGILMFWVMVTMVPISLIIGILAGMREGSKLDRTLSGVSIASTATPEYVSGVLLIVIFSSKMVGLQWFKGSSSSAMEGITFENFLLPVATIALYGIGYIARMTRATMTEVMTAQYIRTAVLKGLPQRAVIMRHALRNALIAPFTVIVLQLNWLLSGVIVVEVFFAYKGFGKLLYDAATFGDIYLIEACTLVAVFVAVLSQLISDLGYMLLNPRIRFG